MTVGGPSGLPGGPAGPGPRGGLRPISIGTLVSMALVSVALGWLLHLVAERIGTPPVVTWTQPVLLFVLAAMVDFLALVTWRALQVHHQRITSVQAVNRLVLARASSLVGAVMVGGYLGYALSWIGSADQLAGQRAWRSAAAALAGLLLVAGGLVLERACRIRDDDPLA